VLTEDETITQGGNGARTWDSKKVKIVTNEDIQCLPITLWKSPSI